MSWELVVRSSFYKAISKLKDQGVINFEIHGDIEIWIEDRPVLKILSQNSQNVDVLNQFKTSVLSQNLHTLSQI